jgi:hypothetical protein
MLTLVHTSDGVLNPSGVCFGSGGLYGVLERPVFSARIDDVICVGQRLSQDKDERVLLFYQDAYEGQSGPAVGEGYSRCHRSVVVHF